MSLKWIKRAGVPLIILMAIQALRWAQVEPCASAVLASGGVISVLLLRVIELLEDGSK